jgi:hypothetical protein
MADRSLAVVSAPIIESVAGAHVLVNGVVGYRIHVIAIALTAVGTVLLTIQDETASLADIYLQAGQSFVLPECSHGWMRSAGRENLSIVLSGSIAIGGMIVYRLVPEHVEL